MIFFETHYFLNKRLLCKLHYQKYPFRNQKFLKGEKRRKNVLFLKNIYPWTLNRSKFNYVQVLQNGVSSEMENKLNLKPVDQHLDEKSKEPTAELGELLCLRGLDYKRISCPGTCALFEKPRVKLSPNDICFTC